MTCEKDILWKVSRGLTEGNENWFQSLAVTEYNISDSESVSESILFDL